MGLLACVDAPAFALQLLLRRNPHWRGRAAAVVDRDAPHGTVLWTNEAAHVRGVLAGQRYAAALALCPQLQAAVIEAQELAAGVERVCEHLRRRSPHVEPSADEPGVFWLDASGLEHWTASEAKAQNEQAQNGQAESERARKPAAARSRSKRRRAASDATLFDDQLSAQARAALAISALAPKQRALQNWALGTRSALAHEGLQCAVVVGAHHFSVYAIARALRGEHVLVFESERNEHDFLLRVPLRRLRLEPRARAELEELGVWRVADLVALPSAGVRERYGDELARLHALASRRLERELAPAAPDDAPTRSVILDTPTGDLELLLTLESELTVELLSTLERRGQAALELLLELELENGAVIAERVEPAAPTLDCAQLVRLTRLKLERRQLPRAVQRLTLSLRGQTRRASTALLESFRSSSRSGFRSERESSGAAQAFAALRAAFGDDVVARARRRDVHLPEASFTWERVDQLQPPQPFEPFSTPLVRRILGRAAALPARSRHGEDGWMLRGVAHGPVLRLDGPYPLSGGWWRAEVARDYYYAQMHSGALLWIYFDRVRRRWFLQGSVS